VIELATIQAWLREIGWSSSVEDPSTLRIECPEFANLPFFARCTQHWLQLAIVPVLAPGAPRPADLSRRLLAVNRDMRLARFAYQQDGEVVLAAELPTESLDGSELRDAVQRMAKYVEHYRGYLAGL
jgi:hypothetical protein